MKLLILAPRFPYPLEKGDKLRLFHQIRVLSRNHRICLVTITDVDISPEDKAIVERYTEEIHIFQFTTLGHFKAILFNIFSGRPFQVMMNQKPKVRRQIERIFRSFQPDHVYCQLARMGEYAKQMDSSKTIDYMDAFGVGMERRSKVVRFPKSLMYRTEAARMKSYEKKIYKSFDHHTVISLQDAECIDKSRAKDFTIVPNGINTDFFKPILTDKKYDVGFVGNMGYPPNVDAAEYLIDNIHTKSPDLKILIAGARPDKRVKLLKRKNVTITGWMDDIRLAYAECRVFVAPLWSGTGQQNKILEAMAMGIPCITTATVNNAIGGIHGKDLLVANNEQEFVHAIERLLNDQQLYMQIRENALNFVQSNFSWESSVELLENLFKK